MKVKASGAIRTRKEATGFPEQGADRPGIGSTKAILNETTMTDHDANEQDQNYGSSI
jgi:deoxyribose-phosphate aldolase